MRSDKRATGGRFSGGTPHRRTSVPLPASAGPDLFRVTIGEAVQFSESRRHCIPTPYPEYVIPSRRESFLTGKSCVSSSRVIEMSLRFNRRPVMKEDLFTAMPHRGTRALR